MADDHDTCSLHCILCSFFSFRFLFVLCPFFLLLSWHPSLLSRLSPYVSLVCDTGERRCVGRRGHIYMALFFVGVFFFFDIHFLPETDIYKIHFMMISLVRASGSCSSHLRRMHSFRLKHSGYSSDLWTSSWTKFQVKIR